VEHRRAIAADRHPRIDLERTDGTDHRRAFDMFDSPIRSEDDALTDIDIHATAGASRHLSRHHDPSFVGSDVVARQKETIRRDAVARYDLRTEMVVLAPRLNRGGRRRSPSGNPTAPFRV
jgi:hypothetical protein